MLEPRAICDVCGHTRLWHDRDAVRARMRSEPAVERPCYREVGGAACRCGGFRESGELAVRVGSGSVRTVLRAGTLVLLLMVMGIGLLYAYRSQSPAVVQLSLTAAIQDVNAGRVRTVTIAGSIATLELRDGSRERTTVPQPDTVLTKAVLEYNAANPNAPIALVFQEETQTFPVIGSIALSLLPFLLIVALVVYVLWTRRTT